MKLFLQGLAVTAVVALVMFVFGQQAFAIAPSAPITVATATGGTLVVPQGNATYQLCVTNTGATNTMDCSEGQTPTSTNWNFQLAPLASWCASGAQFEPTHIGSGSSLLPPDAITCLAISGSTTATYFKR